MITAHPPRLRGASKNSASINNHRLASNREPEPRILIGASSGVLQGCEWLENKLFLLAINAWSIILNRDQADLCCIIVRDFNV